MCNAEVPEIIHVCSVTGIYIVRSFFNWEILGALVLYNLMADGVKDTIILHN